MDLGLKGKVALVTGLAVHEIFKISLRVKNRRSILLLMHQILANPSQLRKRHSHVRLSVVPALAVVAEFRDDIKRYLYAQVFVKL